MEYYLAIKRMKSLRALYIYTCPDWEPNPQPRHVPQPGNSTGDTLLCGMMPNQLSLTVQGKKNEILPFGMSWIDLGGTLLSGKSHL